MHWEVSTTTGCVCSCLKSNNQKHKYSVSVFCVLCGPLLVEFFGWLNLQHKRKFTNYSLPKKWLISAEAYRLAQNYSYMRQVHMTGLGFFTTWVDGMMPVLCNIVFLQYLWVISWNRNYSLITTWTSLQTTGNFVHNILDL